MKTSCILSLLVGAAAATECPICVVGAGPAGLAAAYELEQAGKNVVVFEKQLAVGGKSQTIYVNGTYFPLGAAIYAPGGYEETQALMAKLGVESEIFFTGERRAFDWKTGETRLISPPDSATLELLLVEYARYSAFWVTHFDSTIGFKNDLPDDLSMPTFEWMIANDYQILPIVFNDALNIYGYGDYREIPMAYSLMLFTPGLLQSTIGPIPTRKTDFHQFFVKFADLIHGPIHLNAKVLSIDRTGDYPVVKYRAGYRQSKQQECSDVIIAFPPTVKLLTEAGVELSGEEEVLFSDVSVTNYFSAAVKMSQAPDDIAYIGRGPDPYTPVRFESQPVYVQAYHQETGVIMAYSQGGRHGAPDPDLAYELMLETMSRLNYDPHVEGQEAEPVSSDDVVGFSGVIPYFPLVDSAAFAAGFYQKLDAMQGNQRTYYASALSGFETVEMALRAGKDIVHSYILR